MKRTKINAHPVYSTYSTYMFVRINTSNKPNFNVCNSREFCTVSEFRIILRSC